MTLENQFHVANEEFALTSQACGSFCEQYAYRHLRAECHVQKTSKLLFSLII